MFDNETGEYIPMPELEDGQWLEADDRSLWIIPADSRRGDQYGTMEIEGPDGATCDALARLSRESADGFITQDQAAALGLQEIPRILKRFDVQEGYYHA